jgi:hypothetical protein
MISLGYPKGMSLTHVASTSTTRNDSYVGRLFGGMIVFFRDMWYVSQARLDGGAGCHRLCNNQILRGTDVKFDVAFEEMVRERERNRIR